MAPPIHPSAFDRIYADVRKDIPSLADATLRQELFRVMDDFTQRTNIWQETVPLPILPNVVTYDINGLVTEGKINRLMFVYDTAMTTKYWPRSGISMRVPGIIELYYPPTSSAAWAAVVAKRISEPVDEDTNFPVIDDWIVEKYADTIGRGIVARMQWEPQKPYSNPMLAQANQRAYYSGCAVARANDGQSNIFNGASWRYPQSFATVNRKPWA